ncbi:Hypothetical predicted protein [Paramuricea clavata]|uniref:Uncharacterized protein n=1 Tax=Paramuricea clavata TaxID=317549 RepID=A0A7D9INN9_PARCT|nr:Hypothetical predicted protein [Paramuricea clavata]
MTTTTNSTGYGPRRGLLFDGNESKYELWEVKFLGYMRLQKLYKVFVRDASEKDPPDASTQADAFAELVQCLDDRSLSLVIRDARDDGRKALEILRTALPREGKATYNFALYRTDIAKERRERANSRLCHTSRVICDSVTKCRGSYQRRIVNRDGFERLTEGIPHVCHGSYAKRETNDFRRIQERAAKPRGKRKDT